MCRSELHDTTICYTEANRRMRHPSRRIAAWGGLTFESEFAAYRHLLGSTGFSSYQLGYV